MAAFLCAAIGACDGGKEKGTPPRTVVLYCSADEEFARQVADRFTKKTGIKVVCRYDVEATKTLGLVQKLMSEAKHPQADVFWSSEVFETIRLAKAGVLDSVEIADWPKSLRDREGRWYGFALRARVIAYDTRRVKAAEAPKSIEDLLDPRWKGQILIARPQFGSTRGHMAVIWTHYGPAKAEAIFRGLKANGVRLVNGNSTAVRMVAEGHATVCLTDTDDVWVAQRNGWPIDMVYPRHGQAGTLVFPNTAAVIRGGPHPAEARALVAFLLSEEVEEMLAASDSHNIPVHARVANKYPQYKVPDPMQVDFAKAAEAINPAVQAACKTLQD